MGETPNGRKNVDSNGTYSSDKVNVNTFNCNICGTNFSTESIHDKRKPLQCDSCETYSIFKCDICSANFDKDYELKSHVDSVHEGKRTFQCDKCTIGFGNKVDLKSHMDSVYDGKKNLLNVLAVNVQGIECYGRLDQVQILLVNNLVSVAVLTETETTHSIAESSNIEGFRAYCPPTCVIGPIGKEVGVMLMISNKLSSATKPRPDINGNDSIQTV